MCRLFSEKAAALNARANDLEEHERRHSSFWDDIFRVLRNATTRSPRTSREGAALLTLSVKLKTSDADWKRYVYDVVPGYVFEKTPSQRLLLKPPWKMTDWYSKSRYVLCFETVIAMSRLFGRDVTELLREEDLDEKWTPTLFPKGNLLADCVGEPIQSGVVDGSSVVSPLQFDGDFVGCDSQSGVLVGKR